MSTPYLYTSLPDLTGGSCLDPRISPDVWHPEGPGARQQARYALSICGREVEKGYENRPAEFNDRCPVREKCLADALRYESEVGICHGVVGGLTEYERARLLGSKTSRNVPAA